MVKKKGEGNGKSVVVTIYNKCGKISYNSFLTNLVFDKRKFFFKYFKVDILQNFIT